MLPKAMQQLEIAAEAKLRAENARLNASNAELVKALEQIKSWHRHRGDSPDWSPYLIASSALARANEGKP